MARWETALDAQLDLWKLSHSEMGEIFYSGYRQSIIQSGSENDKLMAKSGLLNDLNTRIKDTLLAADPIYVDDEMFTLAEFAFKTFEEEPLLPSDLITPNGFLYLPRPLMMPDIRDKITGTRAFLWRSGVSFRREGADDRSPGDPTGIIVFTFSHVDDKDDYWGDIPRDNPFRSYPLWLNHTMPWVFSDPPEDDIPPEKSVTRYLQALLRLMMQTISVKSQERASRPVRRRLEREDWAKSTVTVVTLRRPRSDPTDEHREVNWTHRWLVRGHWRNQWYSTLNAHRQIYINPFIKGDPNLPLEIKKTRAFEWVR